jgi:hypothetical protein
MKALGVGRGAPGEALIGRVLCHDVRNARNAILFRKGHVLRAEDLPPLAAAPWSELHLLELDEGDLGQLEAGQRLAGALCGDGLRAAPSGHRHVLKAMRDGLVKIDVAALQRMNGTPGIAVYTLPNDRVVMRDETVAEAQITPLAIAGPVLDGVGGAGVIRLLPFVPREAVIWMRDDRHLAAVEGKLRWFGCPVQEAIGLPRDPASIRESMERSAGSLFIVSGSNALDPLDPVFAALDAMGAKMQRVGLPVHPGTLLWLASWREVTIVGLPTCGLGTQRTAFDLILPKLLAEGSVSDDELAALGHGGMLSAR